MKEVVATNESILAKQVLARQRFVEGAVRFAESIVHECGKVLKHEVHSSHTTTEATLNGFSGFSFYTYGAYSMFGGCTVKVWYHPDSLEHGPEPVLEVEYWDISACKVKRFDSSLPWQRALRRLIKDREKIVARAKRETAEKNDREKKQREHEANLKKIQYQLQQEATRLKLV